MTNEPIDGKIRASARRAERYAAGRRLRDAVPREIQANCPAETERDPIAILAESEAGRLPRLLPIRYERMRASSFAFLRGAAAVMAHDLRSAPRLGLPVQACGDCHLMNFGVFSTPEERILFDINDFDETLPGVDFIVDLKRLAASVAVAALDAGLSSKKAEALARSVAKEYRDFMRALAALSPLEVWHTHIDIKNEVLRIEDCKLRNQLLAILVKSKKALEADDNFPHLATVKGGAAKIADRPPLIYHFDASPAVERIDPASVFAVYRDTLFPQLRALTLRYDLTDIAMKVVGVGSVGTFCAVGLFMTGDGDHLFLQLKQAMNSVLEQITPPAAGFAEQGLRVVEGQRALQAASDSFLSWTHDQASGRQFYVRQLKNRRLGSIGEVIEERALEPYAGLCGRTLARAHARTGDPAAIAGYMGKAEILDEALGAFAMSYAALTARDHAALVKAAPPTAPSSEPARAHAHAS